TEQLAAVELKLGQEWKLAARDLRLELLTDRGWEGAAWVPGRPDVDAQHPARDGYSQLLLLRDPRPAQGLRVVQSRRAARRWAIAELRAYLLPPGVSW
ncbi:MAG: hypothetical protein ACREBE_27170, partial [bacterium]